MKRLFSLQGAGNCGKSATLLELHRMLARKYPESLRRDLAPGSVDVAVIIEAGELLVGIESRGDPSSRLRETLAIFKKAGCDIVYCAARSRGMTVDWIRALSPPYEIRFVSQVVAQPADQAKSNRSMAHKLMRLAGL